MSSACTLTMSRTDTSGKRDADEGASSGPVVAPLPPKTSAATMKSVCGSRLRPGPNRPDHQESTWRSPVSAGQTSTALEASLLSCPQRSEERRVGEECRTRWGAAEEKKERSS